MHWLPESSTYLQPFFNSHYPPELTSTCSRVSSSEETLLKILDKSIAEVVDIDKLEEEMVAAEEYEEAVCHMRSRMRIALASQPEDTVGRSPSTQVDPAKHNHHGLTHHELPISPTPTELTPRPTTMGTSLTSAHAMPATMTPIPMGLSS